MAGKETMPICPSEAAAPRAVIDACVWHAVFVRDLIVHLAVAGALDPIWTPRIEGEWTRSVMHRRPDIDPGRVLAAAARIRLILPQGLVPSPSERRPTRLDSRKLPDPGDAHVVLAAIAARAPLICTFDRQDFPATVLGPLGIAAVSPDELLLRAHRAAESALPARLLAGVRRHRTSLRAPPVDAPAYLEMLRRNRLASIAEALRGDLAD